MKHLKIIITGGTGFLGQALAKYFAKENHVVILSRQSANAHNNNYNKNLLTSADGYNITYWRWDGRHVEKHWAQEIDGAAMVINLAGKSVNCRYTEKNKREIMESRTDATETIGRAIQQAAVPPKLWINASSATIYRNSNGQSNDEFTGEISDWKNDNMPYSFFDRVRRRYQQWLTGMRYGKSTERYTSLVKDFSVQVCKKWEQTFFEQRSPFTRKIALRSAVTLGTGGVLVPYFNLLRFGLGGQQGSGRQWYSWVHVEDFCRTVEWCYEQTGMEGIYNCAAPNPVTNDSFMRSLRKVTGNKTGLPAYPWMLEFGARLIGTETELILKSRRVVSTRLTGTGFRFKYEHVEDAFKEIVDNTARKAYRLF